MWEGLLNLKMYEPLIQTGLVKAKEDNGLVILKHSREVFWKNLWDQSPLLLEARGHAFDPDTGECIVRPFHKIFNWNEKQGMVLGPQEPVYIVEKINGFMGAVTFHRKFGMIYSTTGSVSSPFVDIIKKHWEQSGMPMGTVYNGKVGGNWTHLFEVVDSSDPHIIEEGVGLYYLSSRNVLTGGYSLFPDLTERCYMPQEESLDFREAVKQGLNSNREGYVVYQGLTPITKVKSKKYLFMKALARAKEGRLARIFANEDKGIADDMQAHIETLRGLYSESKWATIPEQERLNILREIIYADY